jgi:hypothetical protein
MDADAPAAPGVARPASHDADDAPAWRTDEGVSLILDGIEKRLNAPHPI